VFVTLHPIFVALLAWALFRERLAPGVVAGIGLAWAGSLLIGFHDLQIGGDSLLGDGLALAGAVAIVGYLLIGRTVRARRGFLLYSVLAYTSCTVVLALMTVAAGDPLTGFSSRDLLIFFALALATLGGHTVFNWVLKHLSTPLVALSFVLEPAGGAVLAWLILGEALAPLTAAGGLAMLAGIYLAARGSSEATPG
jgi:drug/metabolite transporter (DMT)-like permease